MHLCVCVQGWWCVADVVCSCEYIHDKDRDMMRLNRTQVDNTSILPSVNNKTVLLSVSNTTVLPSVNNTTLLPSVSTIARGMFCGAKYTYHTFTPMIKHH